MLKENEIEELIKKGVNFLNEGKYDDAYYIIKLAISNNVDTDNIRKNDKSLETYEISPKADIYVCGYLLDGYSSAQVKNKL